MCHEHIICITLCMEFDTIYIHAAVYVVIFPEATSSQTDLGITNHCRDYCT